MTETRTLDDGRAWLLERLERGLHPLDGLEPNDARATIQGLTGLGPEEWTAAWGGLADRYATNAGRATDVAEQRSWWWQAYQAAFLGRYPVPNHPLKEEQYANARKYFIAATSLDDPKLEVITVPFSGRDDERKQVRFYVVRPQCERPAPVVMVWAGIDTWKEEMYGRLGQAVLANGLALLLIDMPGVGESPVLASTDAERQWDPIFAWLESREDLDSSRVAAVGGSFGGYWAMKLAYTHREHLRCAVNWGGGVHITFTREWQEKSRNASSYLMDLMAARSRIFDGRNFEDYASRCSDLSLLDQGLLDQPSAELLLVNGRDDVQNSIDDIYLSLDHGQPKSARVFDGGHMGSGPVGPTIVGWVRGRLA